MEEEAAAAEPGSDPIHHAKEDRGLAFAAGDVLFNALRGFLGVRAQMGQGRVEWVPIIHFITFNHKKSGPILCLYVLLY